MASNTLNGIRVASIKVSQVGKQQNLSTAGSCPSWALPHVYSENLVTKNQVLGQEERPQVE